MNKRQGTFLGLCFSLLLVFLPVRVASAIEGGESAIGENVITMIGRSSSGQIYQQCSGTVIALRLVVTAKHCFLMYNSEHVLGSLTEIAFPGSDLNKTFETAKILKVITTPGNYVVNSDDLAIVITAANLPVLGNVRLASKDDIERFRITNPKVVTLGYGSNALSQGMQKTPLKIINKFVSNHNNIPSESFSVEYTSDASYICGGDSGGPSYVIEDDVMVYIGPTSSANREGCAYGVRGGPFRVSGSAIAFKDALLVTAQEILKEFQLKEELEAKAKAETEAKNAAEVSASLTKNKTLKVCIKGAAVKKVFGKNSKCPKGFKIRK